MYLVAGAVAFWSSVIAPQLKYLLESALAFYDTAPTVKRSQNRLKYQKRPLEQYMGPFFNQDGDVDGSSICYSKV